MRNASLLLLLLTVLTGVPVLRGPASGQEPVPADDVQVRPIAPPPHPLPPEQATAGVTRFSFIVYGDTRSSAPSRPGERPADGRELQRAHSLLLQKMLATVKKLAPTPFPVRFVVQSGDAVLYGPNGNMWNVSFIPLVERLTRKAGLPYFFAVGNHDVTSRPVGDPERERGLRNTLSALAQLVPAEGSPRRMTGYPTYAFGYGNAFFVVLDSNIASDEAQLAWVTSQLETLDRARFTHVFAVFHHPPFDSGQHGGPEVESESKAIRTLYLPLFHKHHVRMTICGHDHLLDHFVERYEDDGITYRMDHLVSGGGGAPTYTYTGEPNLEAYLSANAAEHAQVEHLIRPGLRVANNPHHFVIVRVDGDHLSLEVIGTGRKRYVPYGRRRINLD